MGAPIFNQPVVKWETHVKNEKRTGKTEKAGKETEMFAEAPIAAILIKWWPLNSKGSAFDFRFSPKLKLIKQVHCACNRKMGCFFWRFESSQADQH